MSWDITFCANESCTIKESCQRYNMDLLKKLKFVSMAEFGQNNSGTCDYFIRDDDLDPAWTYDMRNKSHDY